MAEYIYDKDAARYRDKATGKFVSEQKLYDIMEARFTDSKTRLRSVIERVYNGTLTPEQARTAITAELRRNHVQMAILGAGGQKSINNDKQLASQVYGRAGQLLKEEYNYLNGFFADLPNMSLAQAQNRIAMYPDKGWNAYHRGEVAAKKRAGFTKKRRIAVDDGGTCNPCRDYAALGAVDIDDPRVPLPGEKSPCRGRCRCRVEYIK